MVLFLLLQDSLAVILASWQVAQFWNLESFLNNQVPNLIGLLDVMDFLKRNNYFGFHLFFSEILAAWFTAINCLLHPFPYPTPPPSEVSI